MEEFLTLYRSIEPVRFSEKHAILLFHSKAIDIGNGKIDLNK